jgi:hypothetical protein
LLDVLRARGGDFVRDASEVTDLTAAELETLDVLVREDGASTLERLVEVARSL